jgi:site-specific DNA recombinase
MSKINLLQTFAKGKEKEGKSNAAQNAVIYTRVSTKEQADTNQSLETQKKYCIQYAEKNNINVLGFFGGTYESAKTDERNEFNRMIKYLKNQTQKISLIIVYSLDRFSRTGDNAIYISSQLKKQGISIMAVTQPIDVSTISGVLQQNIQFIFSKYDNDLRREKSVTGMKEKLLRGEWIGQVPLGYKYISAYKSKNQEIGFSEISKFIKKAFELKAKEGITNREVVEKLAKLGYSITEKRLTDTFRNLFYVGYISHNLLEGKVAKGKHPALITEELFLQANEVVKRKAFGYKSKTDNGQLPMKVFIRCEICGTPFTGYTRKKKLKKTEKTLYFYYYKCNKKGCNINRAMPKMHNEFKYVLENFQINPSYSSLIKNQLEKTFHQLAGEDIEKHKSIKLKQTEQKDKLDKLEERFGYGEIDRSLYDKLSLKLKEEMEGLEVELEKAKIKISNPSELIDKVILTSSKLSTLWTNSDVSDKKILQNIFFPEGLLYNGEINQYRTHNVNVLLELSREFSDRYEQNKKAGVKNNFDLPPSVR